MREYHGATNTPTYNTYRAMLIRCHDERHVGYHLYGGRGIEVCDRWKESYSNFLEDMGERPEDAQLDRIDNNGNYHKDNCRWVTSKANCRNRRNNRELTYQGRTLCISAWAEELGIEKATIRMRLERGWSDEKALTAPLVDCSKPITFRDKTMSLTEWARELGTTKDTLHKRLTSDTMSFEEAFTKPFNKRPHIRLTLEGVTKSLTQWAKDLGVPASRLRQRVKRGLPTKEVLKI